MTGNDRIERLETRWIETQQAITNLTQVTATMAASVAAHDEQIDRLIHVAEIQQQKWEQLQREWQAYLSTIPPRQ
jgi:uncharacterized coiled-coil protein SlyX